MKTAGSSVVVSPLKIILISDSVNDGQFDGTILVRPLDITFLDNDPRSIIRETRLNDFNHFSSSFEAYICSYSHTFSLFSVPPKIIWISPNRTAELGSEVTLVCTVTGLPAPLVVWKKNGKLVSESQVTGNVTLLNITQSDIGSYECWAINDAETDMRATVLNVLGWWINFLDLYFGVRKM